MSGHALVIFYFISIHEKIMVYYFCRELNNSYFAWCNVYLYDNKCDNVLLTSDSASEMILAPLIAESFIILVFIVVHFCYLNIL